MDVARDKTTLEVVSSDELILKTFVDTQGYICIGCSVKATPCSFTKDNKKRPYFRFDEDIIHEATCFLQKSHNGSIKSISGNTKHGLPLAYPNKLIIQPETDKNDQNIVKKIDKHNNNISSEGYSEKTNHNYSVKTILPLVNVFVRVPKEIRKDLKLKIPNIEGNNYSEIIWALASEIKPMKIKMRYSKLYLTKPFYIENNFLIINLFKWDDLNKKPIISYKLIFNIKDWPETKILFITKQIESAIKEHEDNKNKHVYVFFIGKQNDEHSLDKISIEKYNFFCCIAYENFS